MLKKSPHSGIKGPREICCENHAPQGGKFHSQLNYLKCKKECVIILYTVFDESLLSMGNVKKGKIYQAASRQSKPVDDRLCGLPFVNSPILLWPNYIRYTISPGREGGSPGCTIQLFCAYTPSYWVL